MVVYKELRKLEQLENIAKTEGVKNVRFAEILASLIRPDGFYNNVVDRKEVFRTIFPTVVKTLNLSKGETKQADIALEALQQTWEIDVRGKTKFKDPIDWFIESKSKYVEDLRRFFTGLDGADLKYLTKLSESRKIQYDNIIRNPYLPELIEPFKKVLQEQKNRFKPFIDQYVDIIAELRKTKEISETNFYHIKGEIAEILSHPIKQRYWEEVKINYPNAVLIEKVKAKTKLTKTGEISKSDSFLDIWDGIVAEISDEGLKILLKFEVKSGLKGYSKAMKQIFQTHFHRFSNFGDELKVIDPSDGVEKVFKLDQISEAPSSIKGLDSDNVIITPQGQSSAMPNQKLLLDTIGIDFDIDFLLLELGDKKNKIYIDHHDIEALVMELLFDPDFLKNY